MTTSPDGNEAEGSLGHACRKGPEHPGRIGIKPHGEELDSRIATMTFTISGVGSPPVDPPPIR